MSERSNRVRKHLEIGIVILLLSGCNANEPPRTSGPVASPGDVASFTASGTLFVAENMYPPDRDCANAVTDVVTNVNMTLHDAAGGIVGTSTSSASASVAQASETTSLDTPICNVTAPFSFSSVPESDFYTLTLDGCSFELPTYTLAEMRAGITADTGQSAC